MLSGDSNKELYTAIAFGDLGKTRQLITEFNINATDGAGVTPLLLAVRSDSFEVIDFLLAHHSINLTNQGTKIFEEALKSYFISIRVMADSFELNCILSLLKFFAVIDFNDPEIKKILKENASPLTDLILLIANVKNNNFHNNYLELFLTDIKNMLKIAQLFSNFERPESENYWSYQAGITALGVVRTSGPEPTLMIGSIENNELLSALQAVVKYYQLKLPGLIITDKQAYNACMILSVIYLRNKMNSKAADYLHILKTINANGVLNKISEKFIEAYTDHYSENYQEQTVSEDNKFSYKVAFILKLKDAILVESAQARTYLEANINKQKDMISIIAEAVLNDRFERGDNLPVIAAFKALYGPEDGLNLTFSAQQFESLAANAKESVNKFYFFFMSLIAQAAIIENNPRSDLIEHALSAFQVMIAYYSDDFELEYHLEIFDILLELLRFKSSPENNIVIFKTMMEYAAVLLRASNNVSVAKVSLTNLQKLFDIVFSELQQSDLLNDLQNWGILINYITKFVKASIFSPEMINYFIQKYNDLRIKSSLVIKPANQFLMKNLISLSFPHIFILDMNSITLTISNLQALILLHNEDNHHLINLIAEFNLRAAFLIMDNDYSFIPAGALKHVDQALHFALYPENISAICRINSMLSKVTTLFSQRDALYKFMSQAYDTHAGADAPLARLLLNDYFPALIKLTYKHIHEKNARRGLYLCARLSSELLINKDSLKETYLGLTEDVVATLKKDIYNYFSSYPSDSKYADLVEWYNKFIKLLANLSTTNKISAQGLDIDALMYGNSKQISSIAESVKYGMTKTHNKNDSYYYSKEPIFAELRQQWESKIQMNQSSVNIEMSFFKRQPANNAIVIAEAKQDNSLRN